MTNAPLSRFRRFWLTIGLALGLVFGLASDLLPRTTTAPDSSTAHAQDRPGQGLSEQVQRLYGTRHVLPFAGGYSGKSGIEVTNLGWMPTHVIAFQLTAPGDECATPWGPGRIHQVVCYPNLMSHQSARLELTGDDTMAVVYSLDPLAGPDPCMLGEMVRRSGQSLAEWETAVQRVQPGEILAVKGETEAGGDRVAMPGILGLPLGPLSLRQDATMVLPALADSRSPSLRVVNASEQCAQLQLRFGGASETADCQLPRPQNLSLSALDGKDIAPGFGAAETGVLAIGRGARDTAMLDVAAAIDQREDDLWLRFAATELTTPETRISVFPIALAPLPDSSTELWVANTHITATVQVNLTMFDGNGTAIRNYNDPVGLCPGATRSYDVLDLAGTIPASGRNGQGAPFLSLRVEATSPELSEFAPIASNIIIRSPSASFGYPGLNAPVEANLLRPRRDMLGSGQGFVAVLPGLKHLVGDDRMSSFVSIMALSNLAADNNIVIDFYDREGNLTMGNFQRPLRPTAFFDLREVARRKDDGSAAERLPVGWEGTAVIHGLQNRSALLGAVAFDRPTLGGDRGGAGPLAGAHAYTSQLLRVWPDPNVPTNTPLPTPQRVTPTPSEPGPETPTPGRPTPGRPTPGEPTPTVVTEPPLDEFLFLPALGNGSDGS